MNMHTVPLRVLSPRSPRPPPSNTAGGDINHYNVVLIPSSIDANFSVLNPSYELP